MPDSDKDYKQDHSILGYSLTRLTEKIDNIQSSLYSMNTNLEVINTKVDDFSYRLKKLEERDSEVRELLQKVNVIVQNLEPDVDQLSEKYRKFELETHSALAKTSERITKIENNWGWVVTLAGFISGAVVAVAQHIIFQLFFK